ncbi:MAG TPA: ABC transporter ATP-binding protein [Thermoanaerobaculia bacterium]|nr:ABC transporter ATP-binding protein [Thermoanaerobaculia bacterium]
MTSAIEVSDLTKTYSSFGGRKIEALRGVSFRVEPGEMFGLLGPNGAGKTTSVKILLGLTRATAGSASLLGMSVHDPESRRRVGYLPEGHRIPNYLTARQALSIFGRMSGLDSSQLAKRIPTLIERVRLSQWLDMKVKKFSKGMTQRLGLACAMIHSPDVLLLDEPTDGVDPVGRREIRDLLREEADRGTAVLLNSHLLSEIETTCDKVAVLRGGKVAAAGRIDELTATGSQYRMMVAGVNDSLVTNLEMTGATVDRQNGHLLLTVRDVDQLNELIDRTRAGGHAISEIAGVRSSLEDIFVDLIKTGDSEQSSPGSLPGGVQP